MGHGVESGDRPARRLRAYWRAGRPVAGLWTSQMFGVACGFAASVLLARFLGVDDFGRYTFVQTGLTILALFFDVGVSVAAGRLLALSHDHRDQQSICGAWVVLFIPVAVTYMCVCGGAWYWVDAAFGLRVRHVVLITAIPAVGILLQLALRELIQGVGRTRLLNALNVVPWVLFLAAVLTLNAIDALSVGTAALSYFLPWLVVGIGLVIALQPRAPSNGDIHRLRHEIRTFGVHAFVGRLIGTGTFQLDSPLIAAFSHDPRLVGLYALAEGFVSPIPLLSRAGTVVMFRRLASEDRIPSHIEMANYAWLAASGALLAILVPIVVHLALPPSYWGLILLFYIWLAAAFFQGAYQFQNQFLGAHGHGHELRNMAIWFALANLLLNFALIPPFDAVGAAVASALAYGCWFLMSNHYYRAAVPAQA